MKKGMNMGLFEIAVDIGSANIRMGLIGTKRIITEPAVVAVSVATGEVAEVGRAAFDLCRTRRQYYKAVFPVRNGLITDRRSAVKLINGICRRLLPEINYEPQVMATVAAMPGISAAELRAIESVFIDAGISPVHFIESGVAAAAYVLPLYDVSSGIIVNIGYEKTEISLIKDGNSIDDCTVFLGGKYIDRSIYYELMDKFGLSIDEYEASRIKEKCLSFRTNDVTSMSANGISVYDSRPMDIRVTARDFYRIACTHAEHIALAINSLCNSVGEDTLSSVLTSGVFVTGGCAMLYGIDAFLSGCLNLPVRIPVNPDIATVRGIMCCAEGV